MDIFALLDDARARVNVLDHPFYRRWSAGELTPEELDRYAGEYRHAVVALATASRRATEQAPAEHRAQLARHAAEEEAHVELWDDFAHAAHAAHARARAGAMESESTAEPAPASASSPSVAAAIDRTATRSAAASETRACVSAWTAGADLLESLAVLYAVEASQPAISTTKLEGLATHYELDEDAAGAAYFKLHAKLDLEHARQARELIAELMPTDEEEARKASARMLDRARTALEGNWLLLDGVQARGVAVAA